MGRMHSRGKGISKTTAEQVEEQVSKLARKGMTPSQIGVILRDSNGIAQVKSITANKILRILKKNGLAPSIPEDLYMLIKKAVSVKKHMNLNRQDKDAKFRLILIESRIHRLARYYRGIRKLDANWKYESATAATLVA
eukprot:GSChrysophyteH1.ASY1.ANO1.1176.1 assembled CDS